MERPKMGFGLKKRRKKMWYAPIIVRVALEAIEKISDHVSRSSRDPDVRRYARYARDASEVAIILSDIFLPIKYPKVPPRRLRA